MYENLLLILEAIADLMVGAASLEDYHYGSGVYDLPITPEDYFQGAVAITADVHWNGTFWWAENGLAVARRDYQGQTFLDQWDIGL